MSRATPKSGKATSVPLARPRGRRRAGRLARATDRLGEDDRVFAGTAGDYLDRVSGLDRNHTKPYRPDRLL